MVCLPEKKQEQQIYDLIESSTNQNNKVCYLLLRTAFFYMHDELKKRKLLSNLHVIDLLDKPYETNMSSSQILHLANPGIPEIMKSLEYKIKYHSCNLIIIDTINQLLHYHPRYEIQKLTHSLKMQDAYSSTKKIFLFSSKDDLVQEETTELYNDLQLFMDTVVKNNK